MAEMQNGGSTANVDPQPLVKLMAARSGCFRVADREDAFTALEPERATAGASAPARQIAKADYLLQVLPAPATSQPAVPSTAPR